MQNQKEKKCLKGYIGLAAKKSKETKVNYKKNLYRKTSVV